MVRVKPAGGAHICIRKEVVDFDGPAHLSRRAIFVGAEHRGRAGATLLLNRFQIALGRRVEHVHLLGSLRVDLARTG